MFGSVKNQSLYDLNFYYMNCKLIFFYEIMDLISSFVGFDWNYLIFRRVNSFVWNIKPEPLIDTWNDELYETLPKHDSTSLLVSSQHFFSI
jgi:hypothetical protein